MSFLSSVWRETGRTQTSKGDEERLTGRELLSVRVNEEIVSQSQGTTRESVVYGQITNLKTSNVTTVDFLHHVLPFAHSAQAP